MQNSFQRLQEKFKGELYFDNSAEHEAQLMAYSTDASVYQEKPLAVALPKDKNDLKVLVEFATLHKTTLIPRAAGTSLAGQVVGNGIVVDISRYFNQIIEINAQEKWVKVQPGVIRDDLNFHLKPHGLLFGPETSTANRAMIGGMVGNNSCGLHSMVWGSVRDHLLEVDVILNDGSEYTFKTERDLSSIGSNSAKGTTITGDILNLLADKHHQQLIKENFPKSTVTRRNTGYALDAQVNMQPFTATGKPFNLAALIAGSEGTLALVTSVKLQLLDLPPKETAVVCVHAASLEHALRANTIALKHKPMASELVDKYICDFTINHPEYQKNRFFIEGDPAAILMVEFMADTHEAVSLLAQSLITDLKQSGYGYSYPILFNEQSKYAWEVRKAGLGLLRNLKGSKQPVNLIEDCAVAPEELPEYIAELQEILKKHDTRASYYAHAGAGELHVEPIIDLKSAAGIRTFRAILAETAQLVKKYKGSLSGEHGDGRLRGEFIPAMVGQETYRLFEEVKRIFDPNNIFNAGKITATPAMDSHFRAKLDQKDAPVQTYFRYEETDSIKSLADKCSGSGDCRKSAIAGGVMCPSYMATRLEKDTTRARANVLRQFLSNEHDKHPFDHEEIKEVMDLCLSCKGCKTECPSGVDVAKMKAEFLQQYYDQHGVPFRSKVIAGFTKQMQLLSPFSSAFNLFYKVPFFRRTANNLVGFHPDRTMPEISKTTLLKWFRNRKPNNAGGKKVFFFCDEFTNYNDAEIGKKAILLLEALGYEVEIPQHLESGRTFLSKGLVKKAAEIANRNIELLADKVSAETPIVGIEPSAILTLRDEYRDLASSDNYFKARELAKSTFTIEEFLTREAGRGFISKDLFSRETKEVVIHGHCYQKALSSQDYLVQTLSIPINYSCKLIPSGCCGMAGSFGYEKEHYEVSQQVGELVLFPTVRKLSADTILAASGTSCRHQIKDATKAKAQHPVEILYDALLNKPDL